MLESGGEEVQAHDPVSRRPAAVFLELGKRVWRTDFDRAPLAIDALAKEALVVYEAAFCGFQSAESRVGRP